MLRELITLSQYIANRKVAAPGDELKSRQCRSDESGKEAGQLLSLNPLPAAVAPATRSARASAPGTGTEPRKAHRELNPSRNASRVS